MPRATWRRFLEVVVLVERVVPPGRRPLSSGALWSSRPQMRVSQRCHDVEPMSLGCQDHPSVISDEITEVVT